MMKLIYSQENKWKDVTIQKIVFMKKLSLLGNLLFPFSEKLSWDTKMC
jgi:hypothetical protein